MSFVIFRELEHGLNVKLNDFKRGIVRKCNFLDLYKFLGKNLVSWKAPS